MTRHARQNLHQNPYNDLNVLFDAIVQNKTAVMPNAITHCNTCTFGVNIWAKADPI